MRTHPENFATAIITMGVELFRDLGVITTTIDTDYRISSSFVINQLQPSPLTILIVHGTPYREKIHQLLLRKANELRRKTTLSSS